MSDTPTRQLPTVQVGDPYADRPMHPPVPLPPLDPDKVAQVMSPTGTPKMKPRQVPWALGILVGINAGLALCAAKAPDPNWRLGCEFGAIALSGVIGTVSPGLRKKP